MFIHRHFGTPETSQEGFFSRKRDEADAEEREERAVKEKPRPFKPSRLSWELGYAFESPSLPPLPVGVTGPTGSLDSHSAIGGLDYEVLPNFDLSFDVELDTVPDPDYRHGRITFRAEYFKPLPYGANAARERYLSKLHSDEDEDDDRDARAYYLKHVDGYVPRQSIDPYRGRARKKGPKPKPSASGDDEDDDLGDLPARVRAKLEGEYPNLRAALVASFDRHVIESPAFTAMNGFQVGPDLNLSTSEATQFHLAGSVAGYSTDVAGFSGSLNLSLPTRFIAPSPSLAGFQPQFLAFPRFVFEEGVTHDFNEVWTADLYLNQVMYAVPGTAMGIGIAPMINCGPAPNWNVGLGVDVLLGAGAGSTLLGLLNLSYLF